MQHVPSDLLGSQEHALVTPGRKDLSRSQRLASLRRLYNHPLCRVARHVSQSLH
jgi:hypothetical protein